MKINAIFIFFPRDPKVRVIEQGGIALIETLEDVAARGETVEMVAVAHLVVAVAVHYFAIHRAVVVVSVALQGEQPYTRDGCIGAQNGFSDDLGAQTEHHSKHSRALRLVQQIRGILVTATVGSGIIIFTHTMIQIGTTLVVILAMNAATAEFLINICVLLITVF